MDDGVQRQRQSRFAHAGGSLELAAVRAGETADVVTDRRVDILKADLHVFQTSRGEHGDALPIQQHAGGDQVGVEAAPGGALDQARQIPSRRRFAAGEVDLQYAEIAGLVEHPAPGRGVELAAGRLERQRVGAVDAAHRAAVRDLGEQRERRRHDHDSSTPFSQRS